MKATTIFPIPQLNLITMRSFIIFLCIISLLPLAGYSQSGPLIIGNVDTIYSKILAEKRVVNISLPDGYNPNDTVHYPVVFLLDGGIQEDFIHILGLYRFNSTSWNEVTPPAIIVGITNVNRISDMTFPTSGTAFSGKYPQSGHARLFIQFIQAELIPYIKQHYKTTANRTVIGESLAGLLATEILLRQPTLFNQYIIVSPSLWWNQRSIFMEATNILKDAAAQQPIKIFLAVGKEGLTPGYNPKLMKKDAETLLTKLNPIPGLDIYFDYLKDKNHANILHQAVYNALLEAAKHR